MARKRASESPDERTVRIKKSAQESRDASNREDDAMDAMIQKSLRLEGP